MKYRLRTKNYNYESPELALDGLLKDRGIENPIEWLHPREEHEYSPFRLDNMQKAIELLHNELKNPEAGILVVVDSDLDGYSSGAIIYSLLQQVSRGQGVGYTLHLGKEHGIDLKAIPEDVSMIIVPDASSSEKDKHLKLLENGVKIIILDHHEINNDMDYGEYADNIAIVNSQVNYPNPALSGAGVALKFAQAYCGKYGISFLARNYTLGACGIIADVMDMSNLENKRIVSEGLKYMKEHLFLMELIKKSRYNEEKPEPTIRDVGWVIGPNINSIIRLGTQEQKHCIFQALVNPLKLIFSTKRGYEDEEVPIYEEAARMCANAKKRQATAVAKSINIVENGLEDKDKAHNSIVYIDKDQDLTFELSGLIANRLLSQTNKPVILLRKYTDDNGTDQYRGSVRGKAAEGLDNLKDTLKGITGVEMAEGHAFAFGIGVDRNLFAEFKVHLDEVLDKIDFNVNLYEVDLIADYMDVNKEIAKTIAADDVWAHGVDKPLAVLKDISSDKYVTMGGAGQHVKIDCGSYDVVMFNVPKLAEMLESGEKCNLDVVGEFDVDKAFNVGRLQFMVKDYDIKEYKPRDAWEYVF